MLKEGARPAIIITGATSGIGKEIARLATLEDLFLLLIDERHRQLMSLSPSLLPRCGATGLVVDPPVPTRFNQSSTSWLNMTFTATCL
jgi:short-subunit dehydrogenase